MHHSRTIRGSYLSHNRRHQAGHWFHQITALRWQCPSGRSLFITVRAPATHIIGTAGSGPHGRHCRLLTTARFHLISPVHTPLRLDRLHSLFDFDTVGFPHLGPKRRCPYRFFIPVSIDALWPRPVNRHSGGIWHLAACRLTLLFHRNTVGNCHFSPPIWGLYRFFIPVIVHFLLCIVPFRGMGPLAAVIIDRCTTSTHSGHFRPPRRGLYRFSIPVFIHIHTQFYPTVPPPPPPGSWGRVTLLIRGLDPLPQISLRFPPDVGPSPS